MSGCTTHTENNCCNPTWSSSSATLGVFKGSGLRRRVPDPLASLWHSSEVNYLFTQNCPDELMPKHFYCNHSLSFHRCSSSFMYQHLFFFLQNKQNLSSAVIKCCRSACLWLDNVWAALPYSSLRELLEQRLIIKINYGYTHPTLVLSPQLQRLQLSKRERICWRKYVESSLTWAYSGGKRLLLKALVDLNERLFNRKFGWIYQHYVSTKRDYFYHFNTSLFPLLYEHL